MKITLTTLLTRPGLFFENFNTLPPRWYIAYLGFFLISFEGTIGNLSYLEKAISPLLILLLSFIGALVGALFCRYFYGVLWMFLGSKIFGGRALKEEIVPATGYAFLFPGIIGLFSIPLNLLPGWLGSKSVIGIALTCVTIPFLLFQGIAAMVYSAFAVKHLNGFGWLKTLGVMAWYPILGLLLGGIAFLIISVTTG